MDLFLLSGKIQNVQLNSSRDTVKWKLTTDGFYSAASAYEVQFIGRIEWPELAKA
jgi:hypothetical protein